MDDGKKKINIYIKTKVLMLRNRDRMLEVSDT